MTIKEITDKSLRLLVRSFEELLMDNWVKYDKIGLSEDGEELVLVLETPDAKLLEWRWQKDKVIGLEPSLIATEVLAPFLEQQNK